MSSDRLPKHPLKNQLFASDGVFICQGYTPKRYPNVAMAATDSMLAQAWYAPKVGAISMLMAGLMSKLDCDCDVAAVGAAVGLPSDSSSSYGTVIRKLERMVRMVPGVYLDFDEERALPVVMVPRFLPYPDHKTVKRWSWVTTAADWRFSHERH